MRTEHVLGATVFDRGSGLAVSHYGDGEQRGQFGRQRHVFGHQHGRHRRRRDCQAGRYVQSACLWNQCRVKTGTAAAAAAVV